MTQSATAAFLEESDARPSTIAGARRALTEQLRARNIETPELDARLLVGAALKLDHSATAAASDRGLDAADVAAIGGLAQRRLAGEPVARILGWKEFWSLPLRIDAATLVPRPETETIVEAAIEAIDEGGPRSRPLRVADLGTGCGAILLALLTELPGAFGIGTDISHAALSVARDNSRRLGITRAGFLAADMAAPLRGPFDVVVSNPPYIASRDIAALAREVRDFDPLQALDGGPDGLRFYRTIAATASALLARDGILIVEIGAGQARSLTDLLAASGLVLSRVRHDLCGMPRALVARLRV